MIVTMRVQISTNDERESTPERIRAEVERALAERFSDLVVLPQYWSIPTDPNRAYAERAEGFVNGVRRIP